MTWDSHSPDRPFCSARCKQIDLGAWASGQYIITDPHSADLMESSEQDEGITTIDHENS
jgi:uncharacterized protein